MRVMSTSVAPCFAVWSLISEARRRAGITQTELAERAGTTQPTVSAYENAKKLPTIPVLAELLSACGVELALGFSEPDTQRESAQEAALARSVDDRIKTNANAIRTVKQLRAGLHDG